jgi:hypothetical protein
MLRGILGFLPLVLDLAGIFLGLALHWRHQHDDASAPTQGSLGYADLAAGWPGKFGEIVRKLRDAS